MDEELKGNFQKQIPVLYPRLHRALTAYLAGTSLDPEDVLQEAFLKAYKNIDHFRGNSNIYTWLYSIARNICIDEFRKLKKEKGRSSIPVEEFELESDEFKNQNNREEILQLRRAISELPELLKTVVVMKSIDGLSYSEISEVTGINEQTLKNRMFRARKVLAETLKTNMR